MKCGHCDRTNEPEAIFCGGCGQRLDAPAGEHAYHVGAVVAGGRYRLEALLGVGGMGTVYKATDLSLERLCALKLLNPELTSHPTARRRMEQEARILARISHRNVVQVRNIFEDDDTLVIELEFVAGGDLTGQIPAGGMSESDACRWMSGILDGLQALHDSGLVHRDMKPDNVLVDAKGVPKVTDLGVARDASAREKTRLGTVLGTLEYMSPEQIQGMAVDARADIYACGIILFRLLTGDLPFHATSEFEWQEAHVRKPPDFGQLRERGDVSPGLMQVLERALAKRPEARFASAQQMKAALASRTSVATPATASHASHAAPAPQVAPAGSNAATEPQRSAPAQGTKVATPSGGGDSSAAMSSNPTSAPRKSPAALLAVVALLIAGVGFAIFGPTGNTTASDAARTAAESPAPAAAPTPKATPAATPPPAVPKPTAAPAQPARPQCAAIKRAAVGTWRITTNVGGKARATRGRYHMAVQLEAGCSLRARVWRDGFTVPSGKWMEFGRYPTPEIASLETVRVAGTEYLAMKAKWKKAWILFHMRPMPPSDSTATRMTGAWMYLTKVHRTFHGPLVARRLEGSGLGNRSTISGYPSLDSWSAVGWPHRTTWVSGDSGGWN